MSSIDFSVAHKTTDGWILRYLMRPLALPITRLLLPTPVKPTQITVLAFLITVVGAYFLALGDYRSLIIGALIGNVSTVVDCVDGQLARLKGLATPLGATLDTVGDRLGSLVLLIGAVVGLERLGTMTELKLVCSSALSGLLLASVLGYSVSARWRRRAPSEIVQQYKNLSHYMRSHRLFNYLPAARALVFISRREAISLLFLLFALVNRMDLLVWSFAVGSNLAWIVLLGMLGGLTRKVGVGETA